MAADFVGYSVLVTLKSPPRAQIQGVVADVVGQCLTLRDGECFSATAPINKETVFLTWFLFFFPF